MSDDPIELHIHDQPQVPFDWKAFIMDKVKFAATAATIFVITFMAMNFPAYYQIFKVKWQRVTGNMAESPFAELADVAENIRIGEKKEAATTGKPTNQKSFDLNTAPFRASVLSAEIPPLDIDVAPPDTRIIIPRINQNVPIIETSDENLYKRDWDALEKDIQEALKGGVIHYPGTKWPDEGGNFVVTGHSSYYPWDPGRFKDVFALLHNVVLGDRIVVFHEQKKYLYQVSDIKVVLPEEVNILGNTGDDRITLITCTPIGTNLKRLIVTAKLIK